MPVSSLQNDSPAQLTAGLSSDSAYRKGPKSAHKSRRNQKPIADQCWTAFRAAEKRYKHKFPPCDVSDVLDLAFLDESRRPEIGASRWKGSPNVQGVREIALHSEGRKAYCLDQLPGLVLLPGFVDPLAQASLVKWCLERHARMPNETNLDTHYDIPPEGLWSMYTHMDSANGDAPIIPPKKGGTSSPYSTPGPRQLISNTPASTSNFSEMQSEAKPPSSPSPNAKPATASELIPKLRWANIGWYYHWGTKQYDFFRGKVEVGQPIRTICKEIVQAIEWRDVFGAITTSSNTTIPPVDDGWGERGPDWNEWNASYEPDAGIVNFYQYKDTLMGHVDRSEVCSTSPLVSLSLGNAAVFLIGGMTRDEEPIPILLRSGDAVVMAGPQCRRAYHGIPRILENSLPAHLQPSSSVIPDWDLFGRYMQTTRININVRQVFPKGFSPFPRGSLITDAHEERDDRGGGDGGRLCH